MLAVANRTWSSKNRVAMTSKYVDNGDNDDDVDCWLLFWSKVVEVADSEHRREAKGSMKRGLVLVGRPEDSIERMHESRRLASRGERAGG